MLANGLEEYGITEGTALEEAWNVSVFCSLSLSGFFLRHESLYGFFSLPIQINKRLL